MNDKFAFGMLFLISAMAFVALSADREVKMMVALVGASCLTVSRPMPELPEAS